MAPRACHTLRSGWIGCPARTVAATAVLASFGITASLVAFVVGQIGWGNGVPWIVGRNFGCAGGGFFAGFLGNGCVARQQHRRHGCCVLKGCEGYLRRVDYTTRLQ